MRAKTKVIFTDKFFSDINAIANTKYNGFTYPSLLRKGIFGWVWKRYFCPKKMHLWDEVATSAEGNLPGHYLVCDCCGTLVGITKAFTEKEAVQEVEDYYDSLEKEWKKNLN